MVCYQFSELVIMIIMYLNNHDYKNRDDLIIVMKNNHDTCCISILTIIAQHYKHANDYGMIVNYVSFMKLVRF